ncbi:MAG: TonB-dependent receptor [Bacteroidetes bacterium]|nr:TonB-dependent receptor [Bacteroidota bacterium]
MRLFALLLLLCCSMQSYSQDCNNTLYGSLLDIHDGSVLTGATVIVAQTGVGVLTDLDGNFVISNLCSATYQLQISHPSCSTKAFSVLIKDDTQKTFKLEHHLESLNEIIVNGKKTNRATKSIYENLVDQETITTFSSGSLGDALNSISGVSSLNTGNTVVKPMINGLHSSRVLIINNGVQMQDQEWGAEHAPSIDINAVGTLKVIKGAGALQYGGNAIGGVVIASAPKVPLLDSLYGKTIFSGSSNGLGGTVSSSLTRSNQNGFYTAFQGSLKRYGDFNAPNYNLSNTGVFERNIAATIGFNRIDYGVEAYYSLFKNEIGILRASHIGGAEDQVQAIASPVPSIINDFTYNIDAPRQDVTHHLARIKGFKNIENIGLISLQYDYQQNNRLEFDVRRGSNKDKASVDLVLDTQTLTIDVASDISEKLTTKFGIVGSLQTNYANPETGVRRLIPDYDKYSIAGFASGNYDINQKWVLEAGFRFDYTHMNVFKFYRRSFWQDRGYDNQFSDLVVEEIGNQLLVNPKLDFYNPSFTIGSKYSFGLYKLFANYSLSSRAPNASEQFSEGLHHSASRIELGDLQFTSETAHKISLTLQKIGERFDFTLTPFATKIDDFILIEPTGIRQTIRGNFQVWEYRQTQAQMYGLDLDANLSLTDNVRFVHQFSLVKGYDKTSNEPLISMPAANTLNSLVYTNPNFNNISIAIQSNYVFRQNEFPNTNFEVVLPDSIQTVDISTPPSGYHLLNLNITAAIRPDMQVGLYVNNLLNTSYRNYLNRLRYYADDVGRNITLQLKYNY